MTPQTQSLRTIQIQTFGLHAHTKWRPRLRKGDSRAVRNGSALPRAHSLLCGLRVGGAGGSLLCPLEAQPTQGESQSVTKHGLEIV